MRLPGFTYKGRTIRRIAIVCVMTLLAVIAFGASFALAQGRVFMPWSTDGGGAAQMTSRDNILRGLVGQSAVGRTTSKDDIKGDRFDITLGFHTAVIAGTDSFAELIARLALTPAPTPPSGQVSTPTGTPSPGPSMTVSPSPIPGSPTATSVPVDTPTLTPTPQSPTPTAAPPTRTATRIPTRTSTRTATATPAPIATPTSTATPSPTAAPPPTIVIVIATPSPEPTPSPTPAAPISTPTPTPVPPSGGICSAPGTHGPLPLDLGWLMLLAAPIILWRFGARS